ncbi:MAG: hypothetical protein M1836_006383 [Candelina mexicana]|nr:MAG: hypothetical protein M1836_006383 [Candelina mexicana]
MLHEILLSLSGHPSPLLSSSSLETGQHKETATFPLLSPPERALLASLTHLSDVHQRLLHHTSLISSSHNSTICRAVSSAIVATHLARFQQKILEVERGIITKDAGRVGGYGIVPLSGVVGEFDEWTRRMEWFWDIAQFMLLVGEAGSSTSDKKPKSVGKGCTGAAIIDKLRKEAHTGYPDIELVASDLTKVAETAWLRQLSTWVLYGRLPAFGAEDFFIRSAPTNLESTRTPNFTIDNNLIPKFVTPQTISSILFIGRSLNHLRVRGTGPTNSGSTLSASSELKLVPVHLCYLSALSSPILSSSLSSAITAIRLSLSRNSLQQLLPLPRIVEILEIFGEFFLLERGEFAVALITEAEKHIQSRHRLQGQHSRDQGTGTLDSVVTKEGEVTAVLNRTWAALALTQPEEDTADEKLDLARDLIHLSLSKSTASFSTGQKSSENNQSNFNFNDLLFSTPTTLSIHIPSPLDLFLTPNDLSQYSTIHSYLLSIRRAHLRLTNLWKSHSLRKEVPSPTPHRRANEATRKKQRLRSNERTRAMRKIWATSSAAVSLLAELGSYFQGEVVRGSWNTFRTWLQGPTKPPSRPGSRPSSSSKPPASTNHDNDDIDIWTSSPPIRPRTHNLHPAHQDRQAESSVPPHHDPETLTHAHHQYLLSLTHALLLTSQPFTSTLRTCLTHIDHFIALLTSLQTLQQALDLETDAGVVDTFAHNARDEKEVWRELMVARECVEKDVCLLVERLREFDECGRGRDDGDWNGGGGGGGGKGEEENMGGFVPWKGDGIDRLLMKLDFGSWSVKLARTGTDEDGE